MSDEQRPWHRLFALSWIDFFRGLPVTVTPEKDLSLKKQLLDLLLVRNEAGPLPRRLPDGLEMDAYNLMTFKSFRERLSAWTLLELLGHGVNLRKQVSPGMDEDELLPLASFRLFAVCTRFPRRLVAAGVRLRLVQPGVYRKRVLGWPIRIVVINQLPLEEHNALLLLFSDQPERRAYAARHYRSHSTDTSTLLLQLVQQYRQEGFPMPDLLTEFAREARARMLKEMTPEERLEGMPPEQRLAGLPPEQRLAGLPPEVLLRILPPEKRLEGVSLEERLAGLPPEVLLNVLPLEKRLQGTSANDLLAALTPEMREALFQQLKAERGG